jgi:hypothetical protein
MPVSIAGAMTEKALQANIIQMAHALGWLVMHTRPSLNRRGVWATQLTGDPGFPDLVLANGGRLILVELKSEAGKLTPDQLKWQNALPNGYYVWRPSDWLDGTVERILKEGKMRDDKNHITMVGEVVV